MIKLSVNEIIDKIQKELFFYTGSNDYSFTIN